MLTDEILSELEKEKATVRQEQENICPDIATEEPSNIEYKDNLPSTNTKEMSEAQATALLNVVKNPKDALGLKLGESIGNKVSSGVGKERLDKTAEKIIDSGLTSFETQAETEKNKAQKSADDVYFDSHKAELKRGGIGNRTYREKMEKVVNTDKVWSDINFFLFTWWVVGINNFFSTLSSFNWFFRILIGTIFTIPYLAFIPIAFCIGIIRCVIYFVGKLCTTIKNKFSKKSPAVEIEEPEISDLEEDNV